MKAFYRSLSFCALLVLLFSQLVSIATPREDYVASRLVEGESDWQLDIVESSLLAEARFADEAKSMLIQFIDKNLHREYDGIAAISLVCLCVLVFSLLGWWRESRIFLEKVARSSANTTEG